MFQVKGLPTLDSMGVLQLQLLVDKAAISDTILRYARSLDMRDWQMCRACFMDEVETDYSDLRGDPPAVVRADDFVESRRRSLSEIKTLHLSTNHLVTAEGDDGVCVSCMVIYRFLPNDRGDSTYNSYGYYTHHLKRTEAGWKISKVKQTVFWSEGNPLIHGFARQNR